MINKFIIIIALFSVISCNVQRELYDSGELKAKGKVRNQLKDGKWKLFHLNGNIKGVGSFKNDHFDGEWIWYHINGKLHQIGEYEDGSLYGEWKFFHPNGKREGIGTFKNGQMDGKWIWYHTNGEIYTELLWENGKLKEIISCFDGKGNKLDKGSLTKEGNGTRKLYDINGKLLEIQIIKDGKIVL